jgi:hypothetical protein
MLEDRYSSCQASQLAPHTFLLIYKSTKNKESPKNWTPGSHQHPKLNAEVHLEPENITPVALTHDQKFPPDVWPQSPKPTSISDHKASTWTAKAQSTNREAVRLHKNPSWHSGTRRELRRERGKSRDVPSPTRLWQRVNNRPSLWSARPAAMVLPKTHGFRGVDCRYNREAMVGPHGVNTHRVD